MRGNFDRHSLSAIKENPRSGDGPSARSPELAGRDERGTSSRLPLIAAIVAVLLGAAALVGLREKIVRIAPLSSLYSALGAKAAAVGLRSPG